MKVIWIPNENLNFHWGDYEKYDLVKCDAMQVDLLLDPEIEGSILLRNDGKLLPDYTASKPRK